MSSACLRGIAAIWQGFAVKTATARHTAPAVRLRVGIAWLCGLVFCRGFRFWHLTMHV